MQRTLLIYTFIVQESTSVCFLHLVSPEIRWNVKDHVSVSNSKRKWKQEFGYILGHCFTLCVHNAFVDSVGGFGSWYGRPLNPDIVCWANLAIVWYIPIDVATYHLAIAIHSYISYRLVQENACTHARTHARTHAQFTLCTILYNNYYILVYKNIVEKVLSLGCVCACLCVFS